MIDNKFTLTFGRHFSLTVPSKNPNIFDIFSITLLASPFIGSDVIFLLIELL